MAVLAMERPCNASEQWLVDVHEVDVSPLLIDEMNLIVRAICEGG